MKKLMIALCVMAVAAPALAKGGHVHRVSTSSRGGGKRKSFSKGIAVADNGKGRSRGKSVDSWSSMGDLGSGRHGKGDIFSMGDNRRTVRPRSGFHHHRFG
jgi:hypothetical protein